MTDAPEPARPTTFGHGRALALLALTLVFVFGSIAWRGEVIYSYDNGPEVGIPSDERPVIRLYTDLGWWFLPEIQFHLQSDSAGWLPTWSPNNELGRPAAHIAGPSKVFVPSLVLSWLTRDAFVFYTLSFGLAVALTALFGYLLLRSLRLHPAACFAGALSLSLGVLIAYRHWYVMFLWGVCWTTALLWIVTCIRRELTLARALALAFFVHCLLLSAYPQHTVFHAYILVGYTLVGLWRSPLTWSEKVARLAGIGAAVLVGSVAAAPVLADLVATSAASARGQTEFEFFVPGLLAIANPQELFDFVVLWFDAFWYGNPIEQDYPTYFTGLSWSPVVATLVFVALVPRLARRLWPLWLFVLATLTLAVWPAAYRLGWLYGGLHFSRFNPLDGAWIPMILLMAYAADALLRGAAGGRLVRVACVVVPAALTFGCLAASAHPAAWPYVVFGGVVVLLTTAFAWTGRATWLVSAVLVSTLLQADRLILTRKPADIPLTSPLVETIRRATEDGSRLAFVGKNGFVPLPPNHDALLGLRSIHTYNSLTSQRYQDWTLRLSSVGTFSGGRFFTTIISTGGLESDAFDSAGIGALLASTKLPPSVARPFGRNRIVHRVVRPPILEAQVRGFDLVDEDDAVIPGSVRAAQRLSVTRVDNQDDRQRYVLTPFDERTLLFVSQQHHPDWRAFAGEDELATVRIDDFYQGVLVPPQTREVVLRFLPWSRLAWIPQVLFLLAGLATGAHAWLGQRLSRRGARGS